MSRAVLLLFLLLLLSACISVPTAPTASLPSPNLTIVTSIPPTLVPTSTPVPNAEELIYPYTIDGLRKHKYQSGKITIVEELLQTELFTRYLIEYPSDGLTITGIMQIPKNGREPFPVIVMNHGFFSRFVYASGDGTDRAAEFLNRRGYLTISSDYRSWGGSDYGPSLFYSGLVIDVINLINAIPSIPQADYEHVGLWGHSMGGGVTFKVLTVYPALLSPRLKPKAGGTINGVDVEVLIKAAVLYSPVSADDSDIIARWGPGCVGDIASGERLFGCNSSDILPLDLPPALIAAYQDAASRADLLEQVSAIYHLEYVMVPVQIHYGILDGEFLNGTPPEWSKKAYEAFMEANKPVELYGYEGERHSFLADQWWSFMERSAKFFDMHVRK
jgi:pimeloyl-ACP methyl ester carboxylesterase